MKQKKIREGKLLNDEGNLFEPGYATRLLKVYNRKDIKGNKTRIKEWDYYYIGDEHFGIALTIDDNSYMGLISVSVLDFDKKEETTKSIINWFTFGKTNLPSTSKTGDLTAKGKKYDFAFLNNNGDRKVICTFKNFKDKQDFHCEVSLKETTPHSMVIATPFNKKAHFYYNQKINLLHGEGFFKVGDFEYQFEKHTYGVLDWGRGVWTYKNTWYWSSLNCFNNGHRIGFNLGYGFGDTSAASENMLFVDNKVYKLEDVNFVIPTDSEGNEVYTDTWTIESIKGDIEMKFEPLIDRYSNTNALIIQSKQHQVFGRFSGLIKVEGETILIKNALGFAEKVFNRW